MSITQNCDTTKIYSPTQVACGALGGPVGLVYFLWANFSTLKNENLKKKTFIYGVVFILALISISPIIPEDTPGMLFTILYVMAAYILARKYQMNKSDIIDSEEYDFNSNWRVFGLCILCFLVSNVIIIAPLFLLTSLGIFGA